MCEETEEDLLMAKKRKRVERSATPSNKPESLPSLPIAKKKKIIKQVKTKPSSMSKPKGTPSRSSPQKQSQLKKVNDPLGCSEEIMDEEEDESSDDEKMEDAVCSAGQCIRPTCSEVNWVQCDTCQLWYHLVCVGLTSESVQYIEAYYCFPCKQKRAKQPATSVSLQSNTLVPTCTAASNSGCFAIPVSATDTSNNRTDP